MEPDFWRARVGKLDQIGEIKKALEPADVLVFMRGKTKQFEFVERRSLSISAEQVSQPNMQVGFLLGLGKVLCIYQYECETWQEANVIVLV